MSINNQRRRQSVEGYAQYLTATVTRPANTTQYTTGDVISDGNIITFTDAVVAEGYGGVVIGATIIDNANQATLPSIELWLFNDTITAIADNEAFTISDADILKCIGVIPVTTTFIGNAAAGVSGNAILTSKIISLPFETQADSKDIFGLLVVRNAYTPVTSERFTINLQLLSD